MIETALAFVILYIKYGSKLWVFGYDQLNTALIAREAKFGATRWGLIQTGLMMLALLFYVRPASHCAYMGQYYAALAAHPFSFDPTNPVPHRILTSLISYLIGMHGQLIIITNLLFAAALLLAIYLYFRKQTTDPADAFFASAIVAFSIVTLNTVFYGGYNDSLSYLLIFLMWAFRKRRLLFYGLFLLGLFNRETVVFLVPWFALISFEDSDNKPKRAIELLLGFGVSLGLYFLFRHWLTQHLEIQYSASFYLRGLMEDPLGMFKYHFDNLGLGFFTVYKLMWAIPILAAIQMWRIKQTRELLSVALLLLCAAGQLLVAYDTTRLLTLAWLIVPISLLYLYQTNAVRVRQWVVALFVFNLLVPNINVAGLKIEVMQSLISYVISHAMR